MRAVARRVVADRLPRQVGSNEAVIALVWATVDLERTTDEVEAPFRPAERDAILGGRAARLRYGALDLIVEEPDGEARLAAYLARFGEGIAACYVEAAGATGAPPFGGGRERHLPTPLGRPAWLRRHDFPWGPFVIELEAA